MAIRLSEQQRFLRRACLLLSAGVAACSGERIVSVDVGSASTLVEARVGDLVNIHVWAGAGGLFAMPPAISTSAVQFIDASVESGSGGFVSPGGPGQLFRFRAASPGTALIEFTPLQQAHVIVDTVVVR